MSNRFVLMDIHAQHDVFLPVGSLYEPKARRAAANVYRLIHWAKAIGTPVISTVLLNRPGYHGALSPVTHCVDGAAGAEKLLRTLLPWRVNLGLAHTADLPRDLFEHYQQVIFQTRDSDPFRHQKFERLITELGPDYTFVLCGASIAAGIKQTVLGLRLRGYGVIVAEDAVLSLDDPMTEMAWLQVLAKSARPLPTVQILRKFAPVRRANRLTRKAMAS